MSTKDFINSLSRFDTTPSAFAMSINACFSRSEYICCLVSSAIVFLISTSIEAVSVLKSLVISLSVKSGESPKSRLINVSAQTSFSSKHKVLSDGSLCINPGGLNLISDIVFHQCVL